MPINAPCCVPRQVKRVTTLDDILNREMQIRESRQMHADSLFDSLETIWRIWRGRVIDVSGVDEFVDGSPILLIEYFIVETAYAGTVCFG